MLIIDNFDVLIFWSELLILVIYDVISQIKITVYSTICNRLLMLLFRLHRASELKLFCVFKSIHLLIIGSEIIEYQIWDNKDNEYIKYIYLYFWYFGAFTFRYFKTFTQLQFIHIHILTWQLYFYDPDICLLCTFTQVQSVCTSSTSDYTIKHTTHQHLHI